ncbi:hypothetical protein QR98_0023160 [Sarcoptes scabiei]|uniref:Uncharacterized protein n=1 Tax=Sarcoptes scabiei TaxID=52283 RepID=A0A131ZYF9_SARSC|nr:hypothetical protein QR98_0023160 [Sarcoptes scabiei]
MFDKNCNPFKWILFKLLDFQKRKNNVKRSNISTIVAVKIFTIQISTILITFTQLGRKNSLPNFNYKNSKKPIK